MSVANNDFEQLKGWAAAWQIALSDMQLSQFARYEALLLEWNGRMNLTAIRDRDGIRKRHFLDSLSCATILPTLASQALIDIGSGAGFPGIPLKILEPTLSLTLVDSVAKKARFMQAVVDELGFDKVTVLAERAEELGRNPQHRQQYAMATARAVAQLPTLVEYLLPLVKVGGMILAQKGSSGAAETAQAERAITLLGGGQARVDSITLPDRDTPHYFVSVPKVRQTPPQYPRRVGLPRKRPL